MNACKAMGARAFTIGDSIVLADGISPDSPAAGEVIAHEHVHQISKGGSSNGEAGNPANANQDAEEHAARKIEQMMVCAAQGVCSESALYVVEQVIRKSDSRNTP